METDLLRKAMLMKPSANRFAVNRHGQFCRENMVGEEGFESPSQAFTLFHHYALFSNLLHGFRN